MNNDPIVVDQTFNAPIAAVWKAITDKDQMRQWFFESITEFEPEVGFETQFNVRCENKVYLHIWKVTDVVPLKRISYQWRYGGYSGVSLITWELLEGSNGTKLKVTQAGHETFPQDDPIFSRESGVAGWSYFLHDSLKTFLDE